MELLLTYVDRKERDGFRRQALTFQLTELGCLRDVRGDAGVCAWPREAAARGGPGTGHVGVGPAAHGSPEPPPWGWLPGTGAPMLPFTEPSAHTTRSAHQLSPGPCHHAQHPHHTHQEAEIRETLSNLPVVIWLVNDEGERKGQRPGADSSKPSVRGPVLPSPAQPEAPLTRAPVRGQEGDPAGVPGD